MLPPRPQGDNQPVTRIHTGLLIIRTWDEPGSSSPLWAQIRLTADASQGFERSLTAAEEEAVVEVVRVWLSETLADSHDVADDSCNP
jgi:hypothetical protein